MYDERLIQLAKEEGFLAAFLPPEQVPVDPKFRAFCEENRCGQYGANYSCPPDSGTVEEMKAQILREEQALVLELILEGVDGNDKEAVLKARKHLNTCVLRLLNKIRALGYDGFGTGYGGCSFCVPCKRVDNQPCVFPEKRMSCLSAYCVDVAELAKRCGLEFSWTPGRLNLFAMIGYHKKA